MSEFEGMAFDSEGFWDQVKRDVPGLELPERVGPADEEQAWETWHGYLVGRDEPTWHFDSRYFGKTMKSCWPRLAEIWISEASGMIEGTAVHGDIRTGQVRVWIGVQIPTNP